MHQESKAALRLIMTKLRDGISERERKEKSQKIGEILFSLEEFRSADTIAFYLSKGSEVDTSGMIKESLKLGKNVLVPVTNSEIELVEFISFEDLIPGKYGIMEPKVKKPSKNLPDIVITPGLAFDLARYRLGYGKGYYDRLFKKLKSKRIGVAFDFQIVEKLPIQEHDQKMDIVISGNRILRV
ncbi:MAG: 5-formyltetrahydrofolate cyclo-ligase [Candidatus Micrarchaeota archaeon]|nr:5-formyltetrahydrofolate cyclo-ligase [Candidatus Micrarchaeota archaeon]